MPWLPNISDVLYGNVFPGNAWNDRADDKCVNYFTHERRFLETVIAVGLGACLMWWGYRHSGETFTPYKQKRRVMRKGRIRLLIIVCIAWTMQMSFMITSKTLVHIIYLLATMPGRWAKWIFRINMQFLSGLLGGSITLRVFKCYTKPLDEESYVAQHLLSVFVPYYFLRLGGEYTLEPLKSFYSSFFGFGAVIIYYYVVLQGVGLLTRVNLISMVCGQQSAFLSGQNYRLWGILHQFILTTLAVKVYAYIADILLTRWKYTKVKNNINTDIESLEHTLPA